MKLQRCGKKVKVCPGTMKPRRGCACDFLEVATKVTLVFGKNLICAPSCVNLLGGAISVGNFKTIGDLMGVCGGALTKTLAVPPGGYHWSFDSRGPFVPPSPGIILPGLGRQSVGYNGPNCVAFSQLSIQDGFAGLISWDNYSPSSLVGVTLLLYTTYPPGSQGWGQAHKWLWPCADFQLGVMTVKDVGCVPDEFFGIEKVGVLIE